MLGEILAAVGATRWFWPDATAESCCWGGAWWVCTDAELGMDLLHRSSQFQCRVLQENIQKVIVSKPLQGPSINSVSTRRHSS